MSLKECLTIGIENNLSLKSSRNEVAKGKHNISENRARLLPQINFAAGFNDNFTPPVSVTDGTAYGKLYNVTKTLQYNSSASLQLQMPLYSQTALTAVEIAKTLDNLNQLSYEKAREDIIMQIAKLYYLIQNTTEQIAIISDNLKRFEELRNFTQAFYDNQMALAVDLKRINVRIESTDVSLANAKGIPLPMYYCYNEGNRKQFQGGDAIYEDINHDGQIDRYHGFTIDPKKLDGYLVIAADFTITEKEMQALVDSNVVVLSTDHHTCQKEFIDVSNEEKGTRGIVINNQYPFEPETDEFLSGAGVFYELILKRNYSMM